MPGSAGGVIEMYRLRVMETKEVLAEGLMEEIIAFDRKNMTDVLESAYADFNEAVRRQNFSQNEVFIMAFTDDNQLAGYLEYGPGQRDGEEMYITSMQIDRRFRQSLLISQLLLQAKRDLLRHSFTKLSCNVHKTNHAAAALYRKLGFDVEEIPGNDKLYAVCAGREVLNNPLVKKLEARSLTLVSPSEQYKEAFQVMVKDYLRAKESAAPYSEEFESYLARIRQDETEETLPKGNVPMTTYWLMNGQAILGISRFRHRLTPALEKEGGHIGYEVPPSLRRQGYATQLLAQTLGKAKEKGLSKVLITCDYDNMASRRVIEKNGGILLSLDTSDTTGKAIRRYQLILRE
jgi:predicted acetyltransferase